MGYIGRQREKIRVEPMPETEAVPEQVPETEPAPELVPA
jgi:hypothetical protein